MFGDGVRCLIASWVATLGLDYLATNKDYAYASFEAVGQGTARGNLGSALVRSYVPIPAAVWLFGTALIGLIGLGKRKARIAA